MRAARGVLWHQLGEEYVILPPCAEGQQPDGRVYYAEPGSASRIWQWILDGCSAPEMLERLVATYAAEAVVVRDDGVRFLRELVEAGLVVCDAADAPVMAAAVPNRQTETA